MWITVQIGERGKFTDVQIGERGKQRVNVYSPVSLWLHLDLHYVTVVFKSWNIILVSHHIPRTEIRPILPSVRRELRNMIEGDRAASRRLCQSPVIVCYPPNQHAQNCQSL